MAVGESSIEEAGGPRLAGPGKRQDHAPVSALEIAAPGTAASISEQRWMRLAEGVKAGEAGKQDTFGRWGEGEAISRDDLPNQQAVLGFRELRVGGIEGRMVMEFAHHSDHGKTAQRECGSRFFPGGAEAAIRLHGVFGLQLVRESWRVGSEDEGAGRAIRAWARGAARQPTEAQKERAEEANSTGEHVLYHLACGPCYGQRAKESVE